MSKETTVIMRSVLYAVKTAKNLNQAIRTIEAMSADDDLAAVDARIAKEMEEDLKNG